MIEAQVLGPVQVAVGDGWRELPAGRARALFARLLLAEGRPVPVEQLVEDLWAERPPRSAVNFLHVLVSSLRKVLGAEGISTHGHAYALAAARTDAEAFQRETAVASERAAAGDDLAAGAWLDRALRRWRGDPFQDTDDLPFIAAERARLEDLRVALLQQRARLRLADGQASAAVSELAALLVARPLDESLRADLVLALASAGRQADALALYEQGRRLLADELGIDPGPQLAEAQRRVLRNDLPSAGPARSGLRLGLPELPGPLVGRGEELGHLIDLLGRARLVTVLGTGGVGKTRLAQAVVERWAGDAAFVPLGAVDSADDVAPAVLSALGIPPAADEPESALTRALTRHGTPLLLVVDNLEQVLDAAPLVERLVRDVPGLRVVATSRVPLGLAAEERVVLDPLPVEEDGPADGSALDFLVDRIRRVDPRFEATAADLAEGRRIVALCDGLPLALELVATHAAVLDLRSIRERLEASTLLLHEEAGGRDRPHDRSLRASIRWSTRMLPPAAVQTLEACTVFRGGLTLEAVAAVSDQGAEAAADEVRRLIDHGLIRRLTRGTERRFDLLRVIAEAVADDAAEGDLRRWRDRHARHFLDLVGAQPLPNLHPTRRDRLVPVLAEQANLRAAVHHASQTNDALFADLVVSLAFTWVHLGREAEMQQWLEDASRRAGLSTEWRANCLLGILYFARPDRTTAASAALRELDALALDPLRSAARAVHGAMLALMSGERALAEDRMAESETLLEALPADVLAESHLAYHHRYNLALLAGEQGRHADAAAIYRGTVELAEREEHDLLAQAFAADLAAELVNAGEYQEAADVALDVLTRSHPEDVMFRSVAMHNRCVALCLLGDEAGAVSAALAAVRLALTIGTVGQNADLLLPLAAAHSAGDRESGARLFGVWSAITGAVAGEVQPSAEEIIRRHLANLRDAADDSALGRARVAGEALVASLGSADAVESVALAPGAPWVSAGDALSEPAAPPKLPGGEAAGKAD